MGRQDVTVELYYGGTWNTAPPYVRNPVTITRGRGNETGGPTPQTATLTLDNRTGIYNPRNAASPLFGLIGRNTPIRVGLDLAVESFGGTSASGWTPTDGGQVWTGSGAAAVDFTESAGLGRHLQPLKNIVRVSLLADERGDVEQVVEASIPAVAVGASAVLGHVARRQTSGDYYWLRLEFDVAGAITAKISKQVGGSFTDLAVLSSIPGLTYTAGQAYTVRSSVSGSRLSMRVWPTGTAEPSAWTLTAVDASITEPGRYGLASWVVSGNSNTTEVRFDNYRAVDRRFVGEVASWKPGRTVDFNPATGRGDAWTEIEAAGVLRRLGQGTSPSKSPMRRTVAGSGPLAYWPLEDGTDTRQGGSALPGAPPLVVYGSLPFSDIQSWTSTAGYPVVYGTQALADLAAGGRMAAAVPGSATAATAAGWTVGMVSDIPTGSDLPADLVMVEVETPGGTFVRWQLVCRPTDLQLVAYDAAGVATVVFTSAGFVSMAPHSIAVWQNGPNISAGYVWTSGLPGYQTSGSVPGTLAGITRVAVNPTSATAAVPFPLGHLAVWAGHDLAATDYSPDGPILRALFSHGWSGLGTSASAPTGEGANVRLARVCAEEGITVDVVGLDPGIMMGRQPTATLAELIDQCVDVDGGFLFEPRDSLGLVYRTRESLYNQAPTLTPDWSAHEVAPPFVPVVDDKDVRNDITVKRKDGSSARAVRTTGPRAALPPPDGIGVYDTSVELNLADDSQLADIASWRLHVAAPE